MAYQFTQTGQEIQDILNQVPTNTGDISALSTRMDTAEGDIDALNQGLAQRIRMEYFSSDNYTIEGSTHTTINISHTWAGQPAGFCIFSTPNGAWVFANVVSWSRTNISLGVYNSYTGSISGPFRILCFYLS